MGGGETRLTVSTRDRRGCSFVAVLAVVLSITLFSTPTFAGDKLSRLEVKSAIILEKISKATGTERDKQLRRYRKVMQRVDKLSDSGRNKRAVGIIQQRVRRASQVFTYTELVAAYPLGRFADPSSPTNQLFIEKSLAGKRINDLQVKFQGGSLTPDEQAELDKLGETMKGILNRVLNYYLAADQAGPLNEYMRNQLKSLKQWKSEQDAIDARRATEATAAAAAAHRASLRTNHPHSHELWPRLNQYWQKRIMQLYDRGDHDWWRGYLKGSALY